MLFSRTLLEDPSWELHYDRFPRPLEDSNPVLLTLFAIVDTDAVSANIEDPHIAHLEMGKQITDNLLDHKKFVKERCFARCPVTSFETTDITKP